MATPAIPVIQKNESVQGGTSTDFQSTTNAFAESNNHLSAIGAKVAQTANNQMAVQLGYEAGKTPHGNISPPITEFDKTFAESYRTQANSTLQIEGHRLLTDAQVQLSKPNRLSPQLIASTNAQLERGLSRIADNAPTEIKGQLQASFASQLINQDAQFKEKMISQQREDQRNTIINSLDLYTKNALELASKGDLPGSLLQVDMANKTAASAHASAFITPEQARVSAQSTKQAFINGQHIFEATNRYKNGTYPQYAKEFAENKRNLTNEEYLAAGQAFTQQINFLHTLKSQDENLKAQEMLINIASNPGAITGTQWTEFANSVSKSKANEVQFKYIQALKKNQSENGSTDSLIQDYSNPVAHANATEKVKNGAFNKAVSYTLDSNKELSRDQAETQVAASSGAPVPVFTRSLKYKLSSANPVMIESAAQQIHALQAMGAGHALTGLNDEDHALYTKYEALRDSTDPVTAAREATNIVQNQDPAVEKMNKEKWSNFLQTKTKGGIPLDTFALNAVDLPASGFINPSMAQVYGTNILSKYSSFYTMLNGDNESALKLTKKYVDDNYGDTLVNGGSFTTLHPIEKFLGFSSHDATPYIQQDVIDQIHEKLAPIKEAYTNKTSNEYWEMEPLSDKKHGVFSTTYDPVKIKRHMRTETGEKTDTFNIVLQGNSFDNWDVAIQTDSGMRNLFQFAPFLHIVNYTPNAKAIHEKYNKDHNLK